MLNAKPRHLNPRRVTSSRSMFYNNWLMQQPAAQQRDLLAAERTYLQAANSPTGKRCASAEVFSDGLRGPTYKFPASQLLDPAAAM